MTTQKKAFCSVCFASHKLLANGSLARHGFRIWTAGVGAGHLGAVHMGGCPGKQFPHFGASLEGTRWALEQARTALQSAKVQRAKLEEKPELHFYPDPRRKRKIREMTEKYGDAKVVLVPGTEADTMVGVPSYEQLYRSRTTENDRHIEALERTIAEYEAAIENWRPAEPVEVGPSKGPTRHKRVAWKNKPGTDAPLCKQYALHLPIGAEYAREDEEVTCKRCSKAMVKGAA